MKKRRLAILSRNKNLHSIRRFLEEAKNLNLECQVINPLECQIYVHRKEASLYLGNDPLPRFDAVLPRIGASITDYGIAVVQQFEHLGTHAINHAQAIADSRDKLRALQLLSHAGIPVPSTVLLRSARGLKKAIQWIGGMPVILKVLEGTQGLGVMMLNTHASLASLLDTLWGLDQNLILQQFISESAGQDYRVLVVGKEVVAAMGRTAPKGEFRSNIHRGGHGIPVKLPATYVRTAIRSAQILGLEVAGVDLMHTDTGPVVLEVNSSPGFEGIEKATGINVAARIIRHAQKNGESITPFTPVILIKP